MDASETDLDVADTTKFDVGDIVEFQDDGEQCLVTALADADTLTVVRGVNGTTAATHSSGVLVAKNPVFSFIQMEQAVSEAIQELWPHVYKSVSYTVTPVAGTEWYEIDSGSNTATIRELSTVSQVVDSKHFLYGTRHSAWPATLYFNVDSSTWGSGVAIHLPRLRSTATTIAVEGITPITDTLATTNYADLDDGIGVQCVTAYAISKLLAWTGVSRITQEDVTMSDESVSPGTREEISGVWERRAYYFRRRWERELAVLLPRKVSRAGARGADGV